MADATFDGSLAHADLAAGMSGVGLATQSIWATALQLEDVRGGILQRAAYLVRMTGPEGLVVGGAGATLQLARLRATMEFTERRAQFGGVGPTLNATFDELEDVLDPASFGLYCREQYARPHFACVGFDRSGARDWTRVKRLTSGQSAWLPVEFIYPRASHLPLVRETSSGTAAGNATDSDALLRALCEAVERDALMQWWYRELPLRVWPWARLGDRELRNDLEGLAARGHLVTIGDLPAAAGLPCVVVVAQEGGNMRISSGCAPRCLDAVDAALREIGQAILWENEVLRGPAAPATQVRTGLDHRLLYRRAPFSAVMAAFLGRTCRPHAHPPPDATHDVVMIAERLESEGIVPWWASLHLAQGNEGGVEVLRVLLQGAIPFSLGFGMERLGCDRLALPVAGLRLRTLLPHGFG